MCLFLLGVEAPTGWIEYSFNVPFDHEAIFMDLSFFSTNIVSVSVVLTNTRTDSEKVTSVSNNYTHRVFKE